jgi:hypothetical protein
LRRFAKDNRDFWATRLTGIDRVAATYAGGRAVVELMVHLHLDGDQMSCPLAVVAEAPDDLCIVFRTYCSQVPVTGHHEVRPAVLEPAIGRLDGVIGRYQDAIEAGDVEAAVETFAPDGYVRESIGPHAQHSGKHALRSFFTTRFSAGGSLGFR